MIPNKRKGIDNSQMMGARMRTKSASGQHIKSRIAQRMSVIRIFISYFLL
ncbi:MAG: hypothetical protein ACYST2_04170 [Planctomycetota bacterium]